MKNLDNNVKRINKYIKRLAKGDIVAIDCIYRDFGGLLYTYAKYYLFDKNYAEDLLSDVLCKLVKKAPLFNDGENGLNWLIKIIKNDAINYNIRSNRHNTTCFSDEIGDIEKLFYSLEETDDRIMLRTAMAKLSDYEKIILYDKFWLCYTVREIGERRNTPPSTIQYVIKTALNKLNVYISKGIK